MTGQTAVRTMFVLALGVLGGCCTNAPPAEKYFSREYVREALSSFVYAVETEQWDYVYESISKESRDRLQITGSRLLGLGIKYWEDPVSGLPLYDLIVGALHRRAEPEEFDERARVYVQGKHERLRFEAYVLFVWEDEGWRVDLWGMMNGRRLDASDGLTRVSP